MGVLHNGLTNIVVTVQPESSQRQKLGFPHAYLSPKVVVSSISLAEGTMVSLLAGLWAMRSWRIVWMSTSEWEPRYWFASLRPPS